MNFEAVAFCVLALLTLGAALALLAPGRSPMAGALLMFVSMASLSGVFVLLGAHFVAVAQLIFFGGATLVLFLFGLMWLGDRGGEEVFSHAGQRRPLVVTAGLVAALAVAMTLFALVPLIGEFTFDLPEGYGGFRAFGVRLFADFALPIILVALLLLSAILGAGVLGSRKVD